MKPQRALRKSQRDQVIEDETATPMGTHGLLLEIQRLLHRIYAVTKVIVVSATLIVVVVAALQFQVSSRNADIRRNTITSQEAKQAAADAKKAVEDAVAQSRNGGGIDVAKLVEGLEAMGRVEQYVCGGPCPPPGG